MDKLLETRLGRLSAPYAMGPLRGGLRGVERECLRVTPAGRIAQTGHPRALGSALTNEFITTDYSEALLEFVTPPQSSNWATVQFLCDIHQFVHESLDDELLWPLSMPCRIDDETDIVIARYGVSNVGMMKTIYRRGLGHRYGRMMQAIAGVHFNYSVPESFWPLYRDMEGDTAGSLQDFRSTAYLGAVRNVRRWDWLLLYLFGASPAVCRSFVGDGDGGLESLDSATLYGPHATSLRMSDLGYRNSSQADLVVSANSVDEYVDDLTRATHTPRPEFERIGIRVDGEYRQLSAAQLQIENEFYSTIRPKRVTLPGERPSAALRRGGVQYLELRALDISAHDPVGVNRPQLRFLETFLLYCLLSDSPPLGAADQERIDHNHGIVARRGREPGLMLERRSGPVRLADWATRLCTDMLEVARLLDAGHDHGHLEAVRGQLRAVEEPDRLPSARLLADMRERGQSLAEFGLDLARRTREYFLAMAPEHNRHRPLLAEGARQSLLRQDAIERSESVDFETYLSNYLA